MALLTFYVCIAIFPSLLAAAHYLGLYDLSARQYKAANREGCRDMWAELKAVLENYLDKFSHSCTQ
jgi:hypothetical protein